MQGPSTFASSTEGRSPNFSKTNPVVCKTLVNLVCSYFFTARFFATPCLCFRSKAFLSSIRVCRAPTSSTPLKPESVALLFLIARVLESRSRGSARGGLESGTEFAAVKTVVE